MTTESLLITHSALTPKSDQRGCQVDACCVEWFDKRDSLTIPNAPPHLVDLSFAGDDLNFLARVVYAEASGSAQVKDQAIRLREKMAIIHVLYNRLNVIGFDPNSWTKGKFQSFLGVASAVKKTPAGLFGTQFESVIGPTGNGTAKFNASAYPRYMELKKYECADLAESLQAVKVFTQEGRDPKIDYDNFRAVGSKAPSGQTVIGRNRFWKMK